MTGVLARARDALRSRDFRWLLAARLSSQVADGVFQAFLINEFVFLAPEEQSTAVGVARAFAILVIPFSLLGPLTGVVIDRWSRRRILASTPLLRAVAAGTLVTVAGGEPGIALFALALVVVSANRFYLATASAVMPTLVPDEDLLVGNSLASAAGTVVSFVGLVAGTQVAEVLGGAGLLLACVVAWPLSAAAALRIRVPLRPTRAGVPIRAEVRRVAFELARGARRLAATPVALGSVVSISYDQFLLGIVTVLSVVVFRQELQQGVASYGRIVAAGGVGVLVGTLTVGWLEQRLVKPRIVALAFATAGVASAVAALRVAGPTIILVSFVLGLTYPWRKVPADTMVQAAIPDRYRGRVFALYDVASAMPRVIAAALAIVLIPMLSTPATLVIAGALYLAWTPVLPWWVRRRRWVRLRFYAGARGDEVPRSVIIGGEEEPVEVLGSWHEERPEARVRRFRLRAVDGWQLDVVSREGSSRWWLEREVPFDLLHAPASPTADGHRNRAAREGGQ